MQKDDSAKISKKVGGLYRTPKYPLTLYTVPKPFKGDNIPPNWFVNSNYWGSSFGVHGYLPKIAPETIFTLVGCRAISDKKRGKIYLAHIATVTGQVGYVFLAVPGDCKEVKNVY